MTDTRLLIVGAGKTAANRQAWRRWILATLVAGSVVTAAGWGILQHTGKSFEELVRYAQRRLTSSPLIDVKAASSLSNQNQTAKSSMAASALPSFGKGQRQHPLPTQRYSDQGHPVPILSSDGNSGPGKPALPGKVLSNEHQIRAALADARAGDVFEIASGSYVFDNRVRTRGAGQPSLPITLKARNPGEVLIQFNTAEGFFVTEPYWIFENLHIRGICIRNGECEHAFHVVGKAFGTVIRNNYIEDFNAHLKVNATKDGWPDFGLLQFNTLNNRHPRKTHNSVTPFDLVAANGWVVADNIVSNFIKADGNLVSYGIFMKGAGDSGRIERNLVVCTDKDISQPGSRVGISFGGGGTQKEYCRDQLCISEHQNGIAINNIIAHCNDVGIYLNRSTQTLLAHNTVLNTSGIDVRFPSSSATTYGNLLNGRIKTRDDGTHHGQFDIVTSGPLHELSSDPAKRPPPIQKHKSVGTDFCAIVRQTQTSPGATEAQSPCIKDVTPIGPLYLGELKRNQDGRDEPIQRIEPRPAAIKQVPNTARPANRPPATHRVGVDKPNKTIAQAAKTALDGDTVEIDAGEYRADVTVWRQDNLTIRGVGGRARLIAAGASAEGKAIWVVRGGKIAVENIEFSGARVSDRNGAGIRLEKGQLSIRNCRFTDNENGILTGNMVDIELNIEDSEFDHNGHGDGLSHNLYVGTINKLRVTGSYFHHARIGHLLKSRARENHIFYNRLTDEKGGTASYELEFPNGGLAYVVGNIIQQSATTENAKMISFGAEGYRHESNQIYLVHNTLDDQKPGGGIFLHVQPGAQSITTTNNLTIGRNKLEPSTEKTFSKNNVAASRNSFVDADNHDYRVRNEFSRKSGAPFVPIFNGINLMPAREYRHPASTSAIQSPTLPGGIQGSR